MPYCSKMRKVALELKNSIGEVALRASGGREI